MPHEKLKIYQWHLFEITFADGYMFNMRYDTELFFVNESGHVSSHEFLSNKLVKVQSINSNL